MTALLNTNFQRVNDLTAEEVKALPAFQYAGDEQIAAILDCVQFFTLLIYEMSVQADQSTEVLETDFTNIQKAA
jgi:Ser/Thr protein kinase RdoA (MazF antagonist)